MQITQKFIPVAWACVLLGAAGCASAPRMAVLEPIGPAPGAGGRVHNEGWLQVHTARERAVTDLNGEEFFWNNDFGQNQFLYRPVHTRYDIYCPDGQFVRSVRNARDSNDPEPTRVALPPGAYRIQARAEDYNGVTCDVTVPVVIEGGATTVAYLDQKDWAPTPEHAAQDIVRLPNGRGVGWLASPAALASHPAQP